MAGNCSAYLLVGPPQVGKGYLARLMTASLHSEANIERVHPDTVIFDDILTKNSGEKEENRWKKSTDDFIHAIFLSPVVSPVRIGILEDIDRFSPQALNALLKTLEEPPADTVLILTAQEVGNILPTILSRVRMIRLHYLTDAEIRQYIQPYGLSQTEEIVVLANGAIGLAHRLVNDEKLRKTALNYLDKFKVLMQKDVFAVLQAVDIKEREEAMALVRIWLNLARRMWLAKGKSVELPPSIAELADNYSESSLVSLIDKLKSALESLEANVNVRVVLGDIALSVI